ncbi:hypothetical protein DNK47_01755 [Mycoplasma wenyonii]|uniref:Uncharacterized protein n=1 Tax=Mycoplasma wenyonii TaxID=65123 RepID=A0A328PMW1_9MOLU|nr:hypothetical protein [Mycoplasma wenyonii]RAO95055.1 hypothetical protein DNK47_01755 [Mycoplasma wenyonii]
MLITFLFRGGAISNLLTSKSFFVSSKELAVKGDNSDPLDLKLQDQKIKVNLSSTVSRKHKLRISLDGEDMGSDKSKNSVLSIYREITREGEVSILQEKVEQDYQKAIQDKELHIKISDLESVIEKIREWERKGGLEQKPKTSSEAREMPILTQKERIALRTFFDIYSYLNSTRPHYHSQLQGVSEGSDVSLDVLSKNTQEDMPLLQNVQSALNHIQWDREKVKIKVEHRTASGILAHPRPYKENSYGWVSWLRNPYRHFFKDQGEFEKAMSLIDGAQEALEAYLSSKRFEGILATVLGPAMVAHVYRDKDKYLNALGDTQSSVELQVGKKLIRWMGR